MDTIFIDTSIFEENNFLESKRINEILKLSEEGYIKIVLPEVTYEEILNRGKKNINDSFEKFSKYRKDTRVLRNIDSLKEKFEPFDEETAIKEFNEKIERRFKESKVEVIAYPTLNIKDVFKSYFGKEKPFSEGIKKDEFPDAFAIISIEKWCTERKTKCIAFAKDKDLIHYESTFIKTVDYQEYLDKKLKEIEIEKQREKRLQIIKEKFIENKANFALQINDWVLNELDDDSKYYDYTNHLDIHDLDIKVNKIEIEDYQITSVTENEIFLQSDVSVDFKIEITTDDENYSKFDHEDKVWYYFDKKIERIEEARNITVDFIYQIPIAGEEFAELVIEEINEGRYLHV